MNVAILFADFGPYHIARIKEFSRRLKLDGNDLVAIRFCDKVGTYSWDTGLPMGIASVKLLDSAPASKWDCLKLGYKLFGELQRRKIKYIFLPSYSPLPNALAFVAAKLAGIKLILMSDSWAGTESVRWFGRQIKKIIVSQFHSALVAGQPQIRYMAGLGMPSNRIFTGYDVIDVEYFTEEASKWKQMPLDQLPIDNLPGRYFLSLGRFIDKKNLFRVIEAYAAYCDGNVGIDIPLVLVGDGPLREALIRSCGDFSLNVIDGVDNSGHVSKSRLVVIYPFQQISCTPLFYAKCEAFILASTHEEWGLVINEAQACGVPVVVSSNVGCAQDLVEEGKNGFIFDPYSPAQLANILGKFASFPELSKHLGASGAKTSQYWKLSRFAESALECISSISKGVYK